jgi:hypothetical protein
LERFNFVSRDCPVCYRTGTIVGQLHAGATLVCRGTVREPGCFRSFVYEPPFTLARLDTSRAVDNRCKCGAFIGAAIERCQICIAQDAREARQVASGNRWAA